MSSYFWIKLYHEILHDPKMGRLTDNLWRRVIEIFLLAGENDDNGNLPPLESMAWTLRLSTEELEANLQSLEKVNIVSLTPTGWHVTHYTQRQAAIPTKERVSAHRDRVKKQEYYADETPITLNGNESVTSRNTDIDIEIDIENKEIQTQSQYRAALTRLEMRFSELTGIPLPPRETKRDKKSGASGWWNPLGVDIYKNLCAEDLDISLKVIEMAIKKMQAANLTISSPRSIVKVAASERGRLNGSARGKAQPDSMRGYEKV